MTWYGIVKDNDGDGHLTPLPFGETTVMGDTLTWDGNTEGLYSVLDIMYLVSETVPSLEQLQNGFTITGVYGTEETTQEFTSENVIDIEKAGAGTNLILIETDMLPIIIATSDNATMIEGDTTITVEKAGVYFPYVVEDGVGMYFSSFITKDTSVIKKIDQKFIPTETEVVFTIDGDLPSAIGATRTATCNKSIAELFGAYRSELINCSIKNNQEFLNGDEVTQETTREFKPYNVTIANNIESGYESISIGFADNSATSVSHYAIGVNTTSNEIIVIRAA